MGLIRFLIVPLALRAAIAVGLALLVIFTMPQLRNTPLEATIVLPLYVGVVASSRWRRYRARRVNL